MMVDRGGGLVDVVDVVVVEVLMRRRRKCLPDALRNMALTIAGLLIALVPLEALPAAVTPPDVNCANALAIADDSAPVF